MGSGSFNVKAYARQAQEAKKEVNSGFTAKSMCDEFNPARVEKRFSKRGPFNDFKDVITVLIGLDVTGSMDIIPKSLLQGKLGSLMEDLKKAFNRPNENLQISFAGLGDAKTDRAPLQVTHFESDNRFATQLQKLWLEGGGGGNGAESYNILWWYAAHKTHLNYTQQDHRKGILITIGDDNVHPNLTASEIQAWLDPQYDGKDISNSVLLNAVRQQYDVYHIVITDGNAYGYDYLQKANKSKQQQAAEAQQWVELLGPNHVLSVQSKNVADAIAEIIKRHRPNERAEMLNLTEQEWETKNKENLSDEQWREVLSYTLCPLTREYMEHPTDWSESKKAYEKRALENYVQEKQADPLSHKKLTLAELRPNLNIAQLCLNYKPFFVSLPEERKEHLIELTLPSPAPHKEIKEIANNPHNFFAVNQQQVMADKAEEHRSPLECPITLEIMKDPMMLVATGQTYEREAIEHWLANNNTDPKTGVELKDKSLIPNYALKSLCENAHSQVKIQP